MSYFDFKFKVVVTRKLREEDLDRVLPYARQLLRCKDIYSVDYSDAIKALNLTTDHSGQLEDHHLSRIKSAIEIGTLTLITIGRGSYSFKSPFKRNAEGQWEVAPTLNPSEEDAMEGVLRKVNANKRLKTLAAASSIPKSDPGIHSDELHDKALKLMQEGGSFGNSPNKNAFSTARSNIFDDAVSSNTIALGAATAGLSSGAMADTQTDTQTTNSKMAAPAKAAEEDEPKDYETLLIYRDPESTPAREVEFEAVLDGGEVVTGKTDKQGKAYLKSCRKKPKTIRFGRKKSDRDAAISELDGKRDQLRAEVDDVAYALSDDFYQKALKNPGSPDVKQAIETVIQRELDALKEKAEAFNRKPGWEKLWEHTKSAAKGVGTGISEYIPDLGELGELMDLADISTLDLYEAMLTGDIAEIQAKLNAVGNRAELGLEHAGEAMELLIVMSRDEETREILMGLPKRVIEVTPDDKLTEISASFATQTGVDGAAVVTTGTVAALLTAYIGGAGGIAASAATIAATTARKVGKLMEGISDILMSMTDPYRNACAAGGAPFQEKHERNVYERTSSGGSGGGSNNKDDKKKKNDGKKCKRCGDVECKNKVQTDIGGGENTRVENTLYNGIRKRYPGYPETHPWFQGPNSLEVHHVIPCEAVKSASWKETFNQYGYDINEEHNTLTLPGNTDLACELAVQRHRSNHGRGIALDKAKKLKELESIEEKDNAEELVKFYRDFYKTESFKRYRYHKAVASLIADFTNAESRGSFCKRGSKSLSENEIKTAFEKQMNRYSKKILTYIDKFTWTIATDSRDYMPGSPYGCSGAKGITDKKRGKHCPHNRNHDLGYGKHQASLKLGY